MRLLILTVQRTGGTSLTEALRLALDLNAAEHEPFQTSRRWGGITLGYRQNQDDAKLARDLRSVLEHTSLVKHCCELHEDKFNQLLIDAAATLGYTFIVLFRANEFSRLISRIFAIRTGLWFRSDGLIDRRTHRQWTHEELIAHLRNTPQSEIDEEIRVSKASVASLLATVDHLKRRRQSFILVRYEDLFDLAETGWDLRLSDLLRKLQFCQNIAQILREDIRELMTANQQGKRGYYAYIPFQEKIRERVDAAWDPLTKTMDTR